MQATILKFLFVVNQFQFSSEKLQSADHDNCLVFDSSRVFTNKRFSPTFVHVTRLRYPEESPNDSGFYDEHRYFQTENVSNVFEITDQEVERQGVFIKNEIQDVEVVNITLNGNWPRYEQTPIYDRRVVQIFIGNDFRVFFDYFIPANMIKVSRLARTWHVFYFTSKQTSMGKVAKFLFYIWKQFGILNVIAQIPCSPKYREDVAVYKPFMVNSKHQYGQVEIYSIASALKNPLYLSSTACKLNRYPLKVSIFERYPTAIKHLPDVLHNYKIYRNIPNTSTFYGLDGVVLSEISTALNFAIKIAMSRENQYYGYVVSNGSIIGSLGQIVQKVIDLQANARYFMNDDISSVEYTTFFIFDYLCILVSKSETIPKWLEIVYVFLTKANIVAMAVWMVCCYFNVMTRATIVVSKQEAVMEMYCTAIGHPRKALIVVHPKMSRRIFITTCLIFSMISIPLLTAKLIKTLTSVNWWPDINSLEELLKSGLNIKSSVNPFVSKFNQVYEKLSQRVDTNWINTTSIELAAQSKQWAALERLKDAKLQIASRYIDDKGIPLLHIIPEYVTNHYMGYIVPAGSPYLLLINKVVTRFSEAGLLEKWYTDFEDAFAAEARLHKEGQLLEDTRCKAFNMIDLQSVFYMMCCGYLISLVVFFVEVIF